MFAILSSCWWHHILKINGLKGNGDKYRIINQMRLPPSSFSSVTYNASDTLKCFDWRKKMQQQQPNNKTTTAFILVNS